ncbi:MAG: hypothetical protein ACREH8_09970 [Opitutaceae bacterium]
MPVSLLVRIFFWSWFGAAIAAGHFLVLQRLPPVATPVVAFAVAAPLLLAYYRISAVHAWVDSLDLRTLVLVNVTRFVGLYLLVQYQRGELPRAFAMYGGVTDLVVATMALPLAFAPVEETARHRGIVIWNVVGFAGVVIATIAAVRINLVHPMPLRALTHLPLSLLPTFLTPLLLAIHVIIFDRTRQSRRSD